MAKYFNCVVKYIDEDTPMDVWIKSTEEYIDTEDDNIFFYGLSQDEIIECINNKIILENEWQILELKEVCTGDYVMRRTLCTGTIKDIVEYLQTSIVQLSNDIRIFDEDFDTDGVEQIQNRIDDCLGTINGLYQDLIIEYINKTDVVVLGYNEYGNYIYQVNRE